MRIIAPEALRTKRVEEKQGLTPDAADLVRRSDRELAAQARAALLANPITRPLHLHITCENGHLSIRGVVQQDEQRKIAQEIVGTIPGVRRLLDEIVVARRVFPRSA